MSSFPHFMKSTKTTFSRPAKQGGRFGLDLYPAGGSSSNHKDYEDYANQDSISLPPQRPIEGEIDGEQKQKKGQRQLRAYSLINIGKKFVPSKKVANKLSLKIPPVKKSIFDIKKDLLKSKFITQPPSTLQSEFIQVDQQNLLHKMKGEKCVFARINQCLDESQRLESKLFECIIITSEARGDILRFHDEVDRAMVELKESVEEGFNHLRKAISKNKRQINQQIKRSEKDLVDTKIVYSNIRTVTDFMQNKTGRLESILEN